MHYHILLTDCCDSECRYCYQKSMKDVDDYLSKRFTCDFSAPSHSEVEVNVLKAFLQKDENPVLIFYGGEPLLEIEKIKEIIDSIAVPFRMQTNGKLLNELPEEYLNRMEKILVSLDGDRKRTDLNRGEGTYDRVMGNLSLIRKKYRGEIVARMCVAQNCPDIYEQVLSLLDDGFSSVHWQLDVGFYRYDFDEKSIKRFIEEYNKSVTKLINFWVKEMEKGRVIRLYPFVGVISSLLKGEKTKLRCGAGHAGYAITTNGKVIACPVMNFIEDFVAGTLETDPHDLKTFEVSGRCVHCEIKDVCGGRCLYWNKANLWPEEGDDFVCETVYHLVKELKGKNPHIKELIQKNVIKIENFDYEKYFGPEIIP